MKPAPMPWSVCRPGLIGGRLDRHHLELGLAALERLTDAGDRATGADTADEHVDLAFGVLPNLLGRGPAVHLGVGRILELLRHEVLAAGAADLLGMADGPRHAFSRRREHEFGPERRLRCRHRWHDHRRR